MKSIIKTQSFSFLVILLFIHAGLMAQSPAYVWAKSIGGTGADNSTSIAKDGSDNVFVGGTISGTADLDPSAGTANFTSAGGTDLFIAKYNSSGAYQWGFIAGSTNSDNVTDVVVDGSGNIYVTGSFIGTVDFDPSASTANLVSAAATTSDIFIAKYDANGNYVWAKRVGGSTGNDVGKGIALDGSGNVIISGYFFGTVDFDPSAATANLVAFGSFDACLAKYDGSGNYVWAKKLGGTSTDNGGKIAIDGSDNIYMVGLFNGTADMDPSAATANITSNGAQDIFVGKYTSAGVYTWAFKLGGTTTDQASDICLDAGFNAVITGLFNGTVDFDPGASTSNLVSTGGNEIFVAKYNSSGSYVWAGSMGGTLADIGMGVTTDASSKMYVTGNFTGAADFDPSAANFNLHSAGVTDVFIAVYDATGNFISAKSVGGTGGDSGNELTLNSSGDVLATGYYSGTVDFDPSASTANLTAAGSTDVFFVDYLMCSFVTASLVSQTNITCFGGSNGNATVNASGGSGFTYTWSPSGGSSATASGLTAGNYTCSIANSCGNTATQTVAITQPASSLTVSLSGQTNVTCNSGNNGTAGVVASGGWGSYTYTWNPLGGSTSTGTSLTAGTYTCAITDAGGCSVTQTVTITEPAALVASASGSSTLCAGGTSTLSVNATGGTGAVTFNWMPGSLSGSSVVVSPAFTTVYTVTATDANSCTTTSTATVTVNSLPVISASANPVSMCSGNTSTLTASGASTYTWTPGSVTTSTYAVTPASTTSYTVTGTDTHGCVSTNTVSVTINNCGGSHLTPTFCGATATSLTQYIYYVAVSGATNYRIRIQNASLGYSQVVTRGNNLTYFNFVAFSNIQYSTTYNVDIAAYVGGVWGSYGNVCTLTTPAVPMSKLTATYCGAAGMTNSTNITYDAVPNATNYQIRITGTSPAYNKTVTRGNNSTYFRLSSFTGILTNTTYSVDIAAYVSGAWGSFGTVCTITTGATLRLMNEGLGTPDDLIVYPNPVTENQLNVDLGESSNDEGVAQVEIFNTLGELVYSKDHSFSNKEIKDIVLPQGLTEGIYLLHVSTEEMNAVKRIIVNKN